jgi:hypothetical protein
MSALKRVPGQARQVTGATAGHPEYSAARGPPSPTLSSRRTSAFSPTPARQRTFPIQEIKHS